MKNAKRLRIERGWLEKALEISGETTREMFIYTCIGKALSAPQYEAVEGFPWPEAQALWERTVIIPISQDNDGYIEFE